MSLRLALLGFCLFILFMASSFMVLAQPDPTADPDVPITGIEILVALGGLLGAKKIFDSGKKKKN